MICPYLGLFGPQNNKKSRNLRIYRSLDSIFNNALMWEQFFDLNGQIYFCNFFRLWWKETSWCTGMETLSSARTGALAPSIRSASRPVDCLVTASWPGWPIVIQTEGRCSSQSQQDNLSSCYSHQPTSETTCAQSTSKRSTSTATRGSRWLPEPGTIRRTSNHSRSTADNGRR